MSAVCLLALGGALLATLPGDTVTLSWVHSVEKTEWREVWRADAGHLVPVEARIKGFGAGMEAPPGAWLSGGWLVWHPAVAPAGGVVLAASGFVSDHTVCVAGACRPLRRWIGDGVFDDAPVRLDVCPQS